MVMTVHVDIVSAEKEIFSGLAEMVFAPAELGEVGISPRHAPLISKLNPGEVRVKVSEKETQEFYVSGGLLEVQPHLVTVLADTAIRAKDIDEAAALEAKAKAEEALEDKSGKIDYATAQAQLADAMMQLRALDRLRKRAS
ncbi:F-type H+-transporting ATPase subunit epsilon [Bathymodiolus platifrons methanotrophic gill symbiont]|uniref:F0F1 ATP synthase subunit epsilon n=1 Tax=Bathymodiolus platifrons methanotrophic gill symbiont TaxID=113268 RepID=UPI000B421B76|nr:F0F1 ATP synthase subunit epsilon [Bathymodiolus platifrons methanotrophic gill symbiont]MCK5870164.1 F0F1 ATP synthase subunit epsilon [Methyloprofundus sp.]TXK97815.1 F0F1 ATP synthase subunit epsilon [Methylococcaceae bacterium CS4]TXL00392.1 F0F1 ATP synthase subunit epsilon [Methylococcaceae bacterium CS5]TXL07522.1 F0F1 ATP synthase subunit epsilon [Methylococcaceae bacterium CS3]TXL08059.1 F0F1 ATP synthase subunit epsilon [Methylococcaceae bacterium CS1]TXL11216.1 F0F1 ATP synthase